MSGMLMSSGFHFKYNLQRFLSLLILLVSLSPCLLVSLSPVLQAQESIALSWPLTSPDRVYIPNSVAQTGFAAGGAVGKVVFDRNYGAMAGGWNSVELNPDAFYEYRVIPPEGSRLELDRLSLDLSLGSGGMNAAVYYSTDGFRNHRQELGQPVFFYTTDPQTLSFTTAITVSHPDTLLVRVYAWGAEGLNTEFNNRNVRMEGVSFGNKEVPKTSNILASYIAIATGNWDNPATWSAGIIPGPSDSITINAGVTVTMNVDGSCHSIIDMLGTSSIVAGGGTLTLLYSSAISGLTGTAIVSCPVVMPADAYLNITGTLDIQGVVSGAANFLIKEGIGTLTLSGANTYNGQTTISNGTIKLGTPSTNAAAGPLGTASSGTTVYSFGGGACLDLNGYSLTLGATEALTISGTGVGGLGALTNSSATSSIYSGSITISIGGAKISGVNGAIDITGSNVYMNYPLNLGGTIGGSISSIISGTSPITKSDNGTWTLSGINTYIGPTYINAGILSVAIIGNGGVAGNLGAATNAAANLVLGGGTLQYTGNTASTNRNFTLTPDSTSAIDVTTNNLTLTGASLASTGGLTKLGAGTLILSKANLYTGLTTINTGTLRYGISNALADGSSIKVDGGTLNILSFNDQVIAVTLINGSISGTTGILTGSSYSVENGSISAILAGPSSNLTKTTSGTVTLTRNNTYTGTSTITSGELRLNPVSSPATFASKMVLNGGTLGSTNILNGTTWTSNKTLQLTENSSITLGSSVHSLNFANSSAESWIDGKLLIIYGWTGTLGSSGTSGRIFVGTNASGLNDSQLAKIRFDIGGVLYPAIILTTGEVVPYDAYITTNNISGSPFCEGQSGIKVDFKYYPEYYFPVGITTFIAQLSDASGSFASPVDLQSVPSDTSGFQTIWVTIPLPTPYGTGYRIRVISDTPAETGNGSNNLTIYKRSVDPSSATASPSEICSGESSTLTLNGGGGGTSEVIAWYTGSCGGTPVGTGNPLVVSPAVTTTYFGRYEDPDPCDFNTACVFVTVTVVPAATITLTSGNNDQTVCINTAIANITYTTTGATGATFAGLPSGVSGTYSGGNITISGTPVVSGTFNYTITLTGGCGDATATGTITVNAENTITLTSGNNIQTVCINTAIANIYYTTTSATGATFSGLPTGVTGTFSGGNIIISGTPVVSGIFNYTITLTGGCGTVTATGTISVNPDNTITLTSGNNTQTVCINTAIANITYTTTGATGATFAGLPSGVSGTYSGGNITISGTPVVSGTFNFTITLTGGCGVVTENGTITVSPDATIELTSAPGTDNQVLCTYVAIIPITYAVGGGGTGATVIGLPSGVTGSFAGGIFTISGTPVSTGTFTYTVSTTGTCAQTSASGTITTSPVPSVTPGTVASVCPGAIYFSLPYTVTGSPTIYSIINGTPPLAGFTPIINAPLTPSPISVPLPPGSGPGTYQFIMSVKVTEGCSSLEVPFNVTFEDVVAPVAKCKPFTAYLNSSGTVTILPENINNNSTDNCGIASMTVSPDFFTCNDIGNHTVVLTVTDYYGNSSTCSSNILVIDNMPPVALCKNAEVLLNNYGTATITPDMVNNGSYDNCGISSMVVNPNTFNCTNLGTNIVTLTVTDINGVTATCEATVTVTDNIPPVAICKDYTLVLNPSTGTGTLVPENINNGSYDNCGITNMFITGQTTYTCTDFNSGNIYTVTLNVTDASGNTSTCQSNITIESTLEITQMYLDVCGIVFVSQATGGQGPYSYFWDGTDPANNGQKIFKPCIWPFICPPTTTSTMQNPLINFYMPAGTYFTLLTITDANGCKVTQSLTFEWNPNTLTNVNHTYSDACYGETVHYETSTYNWLDPDYSWTVSGGQIVAGGGNVNWVDVYWNTLGEGLVQVYIDILGGGGLCDAIEYNHVTVHETPDPEFFTYSSSVCPNSIETYTLSQTYESYSWTVVGGTILVGGGPGQNFVTVQWGSGNIGTVTVVVINEDNCSASTDISVSIEDVIPPTIICPGPITVNTTYGFCYATGVNLGNPIVSDNCGDVASITNNAPAQFPVGVTTITWTATDYKGNTAACTQNVTVIDNQFPIVLLDNITVYLDASGTVTITVDDIDAGSTDNCGIASRSLSQYTFDCADIGVNYVTLTVIDISNNTSFGLATVTVLDEIFPTVTCPPERNITGCSIYDITSPEYSEILTETTYQIFSDNGGEALDNCANSISVYYSDAVISTTPCTIIVKRNWLISDGQGNTVSCDQFINVNDDEGPQLIGILPGGDIGNACIDETPPAPTSSEIFAIYDDNCKTPIVTYLGFDITGDDCGWNIIYSYDITDGCNNTLAEVIYTGGDIEIPEITCPEVTPVTVNDGNVYIHDNDSWDATATDNCSSPANIELSAMLNQGPDLGPFTTLNGVTFFQGTTTVTWTATDNCGNLATCAFDVIVLGTADIAVTKSGPATIIAGQTMIYTITVINNGMATAPLVTLSDNVPAIILIPQYSLNSVPMGPWTGSLDFSNLAMNDLQTIIITGQVNCSAINDIINTATATLIGLTDPNLINNTATATTTITGALTISGIVTNITCPGLDDGSIDITVSGGTDPYSYLWTTSDGIIPAGQEDDEDLSGLVAGNYSVLVTDDNGCTVTDSFVVGSIPDTEPPTIDPPPVPLTFCVLSIYSALYNGLPEPYTDIIPEGWSPGDSIRPEWYIIEAGNDTLDLNVTDISDNCCDASDIIDNMTWTIDYDDTSPYADISGTGQPSTYDPDDNGILDPIVLWGSSESDIWEHTITYYLIDCNNPLLYTEVVRTLTIKPRPVLIKQY